MLEWTATMVIAGNAAAGVISQRQSDTGPSTNKRAPSTSEFEREEDSRTMAKKPQIDHEHDEIGRNHYFHHHPWLLERILPFLDLESAVRGLGGTCRGTNDRIIQSDENRRQLWIWKEAAVLRALPIAKDPGVRSVLHRNIVAADPSHNTTYYIDAEDGSYDSLWEAFCGNGSSLRLYCADRFGGVGDEDTARDVFSCSFKGLCSECDENLATHRMWTIHKEKKTFEYWCAACLEDMDEEEANNDRMIEVLECEECQRPAGGFVVGNKHYCGACMDSWPLKKIVWGAQHDIGYSGWSEWSGFEAMTPTTHAEQVQDLWDLSFEADDEPVPHYVVSLWEHNGMGSDHLKFLGNFRRWNRPTTTTRPS